MIAAALFEPFSLWLAVRENPDLRSRPLAATAGERVVHASALARKAGIEPGMSLQGAKLRAAELAVFPAEAPLLEDGWQALLQELYGLSPWVEPLSLGRAFLRMPEVDARLVAESYRARVGVAANRQLALLAATAAFEGQLRVVAPGREEDFLAVLPVRFLEGVGLPRAVISDLDWLGVSRVGALRRWRKPQLEGFLGRDAPLAMPYLKGPWEAKVALFRPEASVRVGYAFEEPACEPQQLLPVLEFLAGEAASGLGGRAARRLRLVAEAGGVRFPGVRLSKEPLADPRAVYRLAVLALADTGAAPLGIEALELSLGALYRPALQAGLWKRAERERAVRAVAEKYPDALLQAELVDPWSTALEQRYRYLRLSDGKEVTDASRERTLERGPERSVPTRVPALAHGG